MLFEFDKLDFVSEIALSKLLDLVLDPPVEVIELSEPILPQPGITPPPQPRVEFIDPAKLESEVGVPKAVELFLAVDQVVSLMPYSDYVKLRSLGDKYRLELFYNWKEVVATSSKRLHKLKLEDFKAEDEKKESVMLIAPSERQLGVVRGKWTQWAWRQVAYDGSETPRVEGWIGEVAEIARMLAREGVKPVIVLDKRGDYRGCKHVVEGFTRVEVDIPENMAKIGYSRDQSVTWFENPVICNMALNLRQGEELVLNEIYYELKKPPVARARWSLVNGKLLRSSMEGGNFFVIKAEDEVVLITGVGVRGSNAATIEFLASLLPEGVRIIAVPIAGYIGDWKTGAVHLDVVFAYLGSVGGSRYALVDPARMGFYSALEYDRKTRGFRLIEFPLLMKQLGIKISEPPREGASPITMVNALNLGTGKVISDEYNREVNKYIEKVFGVDVIEVKIPQIEAGGGGVRCATRELW